MGCDLCGAGDRDDLDRNPQRLKVTPGEAREGSGHARPGRDGGRIANRAVLTDGHDQPASAEPQIEEFLDFLAVGFGHQVPARDSKGCGSVRHELGDVLGPDEDGLEVGAEPCHESTVSPKLRLEPGQFEELQCALGESSLVRNRNSQHVDLSL